MFQAKFSSPLVEDIKVYFSDFVILKNKFFIIMIKYSIFIFNMETGKEIKRFEIEFDDHKIKDDYFFKVNYYRYFKTDIKKWDAPENDEFILLVNNNVILFKLNEENSSKISPNILNYGYFPELFFMDTNLKKINNQNNRFYGCNQYSNDILFY